MNSAPGLNGATHAIKTKNGSTIQGPNQGPKLLVWSAADVGAVERMLSAYRDYFSVHVKGDENKLDQLAHTLVARRSIMPWRIFALVDAETTEISPANAVRASSSLADGIAFVFTGQGAQYAGMGLQLLQYAVFESSLKRSDEVLASLGCEWSLFGQ